MLATAIILPPMHMVPYFMESFFLVHVAVYWIGFFTASLATRLSSRGSPDWHLRILRTATQRQLGDHDLCLSQSDYTDAYPNTGEWVPRTGIEPQPPKMESPDLSTELYPPPHPQIEADLCWTDFLQIIWYVKIERSLQHWQQCQLNTGLGQNVFGKKHCNFCAACWYSKQPIKMLLFFFLIQKVRIS